MSNKKICVFTQTYSNNRSELFTYHELDKLDIYFRNSFDYNLYSFHNSDDNYINEINKFDYFNKIKNIETISYSNLTYTETFRQTLEKILNLGFDYMIFLQDDCFTTDKDIEIEELLKFINNEDFNMLNLETNVSSLNLKEEEVYYKSNEFIVYNTNSNDFKERGWWAFDDGPYIANIKFLLDEIYDETYFNIGDIWPAENYINNKISKNKIQRLTTNISLYNRFNLVGRNIQDREISIERLEKNLKECQT